MISVSDLRFEKRKIEKCSCRDGVPSPSKWKHDKDVIMKNQKRDRDGALSLRKSKKQKIKNWNPV